jgi:hypothetical protein
MGNYYSYEPQEPITQTVTLKKGHYILQLHDSYGDGWDDNNWNNNKWPNVIIYDSNGKIITKNTMEYRKIQTTASYSKVERTYPAWDYHEFTLLNDDTINIEINFHSMKGRYGNYKKYYSPLVGYLSQMGASIINKKTHKIEWDWGWNKQPDRYEWNIQNHGSSPYTILLPGLIYLIILIIYYVYNINNI